MITLIAGMPRSGSTFSFNIARETLLMSGTVYQEASSDILQAQSRGGDANHLLLKSHTFGDMALDLARSNTVKFICTYRKPEDAVASVMTMFHFTLSEAIKQIETWLERTRPLMPYVLGLPYDLIDQDPRLAARQIARYLDPSVSDDAADAVTKKYTKSAVKMYADSLQQDDDATMSLPYTYYNTSTFFHRRHVQSLESISAADRIGLENIQAIRSAFAEYTDATGELLPPYVMAPER